MLAIDTLAPLRTKAQLIELLAAVYDAEPDDEDEWIEWKSTLDLGGKAGWIHLARAVLGIANRLPADASHRCGGYGYIVVGLEPGHAAGVEPIDNAVLVPGVDQYTGGGEGPRWERHRLRHDGNQVLVVVVDPPRPGDRIWTLRKTYRDLKGDGADAGAIFVRRGSKTERATPTQHDRLQERSHQRLPDEVDLEVISSGAPLTWFDPQAVREEIVTVVDAVVAAERSASEAVREPPSSGTVGFPGVGGNVHRTIQDMLAETSAIFRQQIVAGAIDRRSWQEYEQQLTMWRAQLGPKLAARFERAFLETGHGRVRLHVDNRTDRHLDDVEITITLPEGVRALDELPDDVTLPKPPKRWGTDVVSPFQPDIGPNFLADVSSIMGGRWASSLRAPGADQAYIDGAGRIVIHLGAVRQRDQVPVPPVWVLRTSGEAVEATWIARVRHPDAVSEGVLRLEGAAGPTRLADLPNLGLDSEP